MFITPYGRNISNDNNRLGQPRQNIQKTTDTVMLSRAKPLQFAAEQALPDRYKLFLFERHDYKQLAQTLALVHRLLKGELESEDLLDRLGSFVLSADDSLLVGIKDQEQDEIVGICQMTRIRDYANLNYFYVDASRLPGHKTDDLERKMLGAMLDKLIERARLMQLSNIVEDVYDDERERMSFKVLEERGFYPASEQGAEDEWQRYQLDLDK